MKKTVQVFCVDVKRAFGSVGFWLATAGVWAVYYAGAREVSYAPDILLLFKYSTEASGFNTLLTLLCVLPYTTSFCQDWNSRYIRSLVARSGLPRYAWSRVIACACSAGASVALGSLLFVLSFAFRLPLVSTAGGNYEAFATKTLGGALLLNGYPAAYFAVYIYLAVLAGAFWSVVGLCASAWITNKFVALFAPYIGFFTLGLVSSEWPLALQLTRVTRGDYQPGGTLASLLYATLFVAVLLGAVGFLFVTTIKKRFVQ